MGELADSIEKFFAKQELVPLVISGAHWRDPARAISTLILGMRHSREGSEARETYIHHLRIYRAALSEHHGSRVVSVHQNDEKVAQNQNKAVERETLIGTDVP